MPKIVKTFLRSNFVVVLITDRVTYGGLRPVLKFQVLKTEQKCKIRNGNI